MMGIDYAETITQGPIVVDPPTRMPRCDNSGPNGHTGMVTGQQRSGLRWIVPVLVGVILAAVAVVYALIRVTSPSMNQAGPDSTIPNSAEIGSDLVSSTTELTDSLGPTDTRVPSSTQDTSGFDDAGGDRTSSNPDGTTASTPVPPTTRRTLTGSGVVVPASWSGSATVTIEVLGECATGTPSVYSDLPADVAVDVLQNVANKAEATLPADVIGSHATLTLSVNRGSVPSVALYTAQIDEAGTFHRYWDLSLDPDADTTTVTATLVDTSFKGTNPNVLVDAETSLRACEPAGTVILPRPLAPGSTLTGSISATSATFTLHATTTDHRREITIEVTAHRV